MFYGIIIYLYYFDTGKHKMPHIHAKFQEFEAVLSIPEGMVLDGLIPEKKLTLVKAWITIHQEELVANWSLAVNGEQVFRIDPLK